MPDPFVAEVRIFAGNFAPQGWAFCNGQLLSIGQNTALFSLIGTTYGGDGVSTFALPDLRGRLPMHPGQGPGLSLRTLGDSAGEENHALTPSEMAAHTHTMGVHKANGDSAAPDARVPARTAAAIPQYAASADTQLDAGSVSPSGGGQPHANMQPYLTVSFIIALQGVFPSRP